MARGRPGGLDPGTLADTATFDDPQQFSTGITLVVVNGQIVLEHGVDTGARPGTVLTVGRRRRTFHRSERCPR
jgi:N-acyl-D-aspartate/D-glutamate deacylase